MKLHSIHIISADSTAEIQPVRGSRGYMLGLQTIKKERVKEIET
jgi:hypothetical protein